MAMGVVINRMGSHWCGCYESGRTLWTMDPLNHASCGPCTLRTMDHVYHAPYGPCILWTMHSADHGPCVPCTLWTMLHSCWRGYLTRLLRTRYYSTAATIPHSSDNDGIITCLGNTVLKCVYVFVCVCVCVPAILSFNFQATESRHTEGYPKKWISSSAPTHVVYSFGSDLVRV